MPRSAALFSQNCSVPPDWKMPPTGPGGTLHNSVLG